LGQALETQQSEFSIDNFEGKPMGATPCHFMPSGEEVAHALIDVSVDAAPDRWRRRPPFDLPNTLLRGRLEVDRAPCFFQEIGEGLVGEFLEVRYAAPAEAGGRGSAPWARTQRSPRSTADEVLIGHQPQDRQGPWPHHPETLLATADEVIQ
jgi:hypothetical protein